MDIKENKIPVKSNIIILICIVMLSVFIGYKGVINDYPSLSYPPIHGGSDQLDYNNMAYAFYKTNIPGILVTEAYKKPFFYTNNPNPQDLQHLERVLNAQTNESVKPYAYRPMLYSIVLGTTYKIFGYKIEVGRLLNVLLFVLTAVLIYLICNVYSSKYIAFFASICFVFLPTIQQYLKHMALEVFVAFMVSLFIYIFLKYYNNKNSPMWASIFGVIAGLLVLSKQYFLFIVAAFFLLMLIDFLLRYKSSVFNLLLSISICLIFILSWFSYNIGITGNISMITGTSGWHDMPSAYSIRYLQGENRFLVREELFQEYEQNNNLIIKGDLDRSIYGKIIFKEIVNDMTFYDHIRLIQYRLTNELKATNFEWLFRIVALTGLIVFLLRRHIRATYIYFILFTILQFLIIAVTFDTGGRNISSLVSVVMLFFAVTLNYSLKSLNVLKMLISNRSN